MKSNPYGRLKILTFSLLAFILIVNFGSPLAYTSSVSNGTVEYLFKIDRNGLTFVDITYRTSQKEGSMWILVPRFSQWINRTIRGVVTRWDLRDPYKLAGFKNPFYDAFLFSFRSDNEGFEIKIRYNHSLAAMIIEPNGIFYSPQIGFQKGNRIKMSVVLPREFVLNRKEAIAFGSRNVYYPSSIDREENIIFFSNIPEEENLLRVEVGFRVENKSFSPVKLHWGIFSFETPPRYREYAWKILEFYNESYDDLVDLFNVTLESANVRFFLPSFNSLLEIGGYVPFSPKKLGDIHLNILYTRTLEGQIEVIALHELVHHFLWRAGISPQGLLWFHEGMAQYVSIEICKEMGYEGAILIEKEMESKVLNVRKRFGDYFGFLQDWTPSHYPRDIGSCYAAAYYVVGELAKQRGGLGYYRRFFRLLKNQKIEECASLAYYLSIAAGESMARVLNKWGFKIPDLYGYYPLLNEADTLIENVSRIFEPFRSLAIFLYRNAVLNADQERENIMLIYLALAILVARMAPLLTLMTVVALIYCLLLWILKNKGVFMDYSEITSSTILFNLLRVLALTSS